VKEEKGGEILAALFTFAALFLVCHPEQVLAKDLTKRWNRQSCKKDPSQVLSIFAVIRSAGVPPAT
jgi:hypothetical protein